MKKRFLLTLLAVALVLSAVCVVASAAVYSGTKSPRIVYTAGGVTSQTTSASDGNEFTSRHTVTEVTAHSVTVSGFQVGDKISYRTGSADYTTVDVTAAGDYTISGLTFNTDFDFCVTFKYQDTGDNKYTFAMSDPITIRTASLTPHARPTGISASFGKLVGLDSSKNYEYQQLESPDFTVGTTYTPYTSSTTLPSGLLAVRVAEDINGTASDYVIVYSAGEKAGTLSFNDGSVGNNGFTNGKWTFWSTKNRANYKTNIYSINIKNNAAGTGHMLAQQVEWVDREMYINGVFGYELTDDEIIPVTDLFTFNVNMAHNGMGSFIKNTATQADGSAAFGTDSTKVKGKVTFYVYGGDVASYSLPFYWYTSGSGYVSTNTLDLSTVVGADAAGYIYRIEIDVCDGDPVTDQGLTYALNTDVFPYTDDLTNYGYQLWTFGTANATTNRIDLDAKKTAATPILTATGTADATKFRIEGLDSTKSYAISSDNNTFTDVPTGSCYVDVTGTGTYYVYVKESAKEKQSQTASVTISGAMPAIAAGTLSYDLTSGSIKGFNTNIPTGFTSVSYQIGTIAYDGKITWNTDTVSSSTASKAVTKGFYVIRYAAQDTKLAGAATYVFAIDPNSANKATVAVDTTGGSTRDFTEGTWTFNSSVASDGYAYMDVNQSSGQRQIATSVVPVQDALTSYSFRYLFAADETFALNELGYLTFNIGFSVGNPLSSDTFPAKIRIYVTGGEKEYYDVPYTHYRARSFQTINVASIWDDAVAADASFEPTGYVRALEIFFLSDVTGITVTGGRDYPVIMVGDRNCNVMRNSNFITLKRSVDVGAVSSVDAVGTYGGEIIGLDADVTYQTATYDPDTNTLGSWVPVPEGTIRLNVPAGSYAIRVYAAANNADVISSDYVVVTIDESDPDDTRVTVNVDKVILPEDITFADAEYVFNVDETPYISRLALSNIVAQSPKSTISFESENYKIVVNASNIDLSLSNAHYFDMKVTFDGESAYDRMYAKMAAAVDEKELVKGIHFESINGYFFEVAEFSVYLGDELEGYEVDLRSYNERVNRLRTEESATVADGWVTFTTFGSDYVIVSPAYAKDQAE